MRTLLPTLLTFLALAPAAAAAPIIHAHRGGALNFGQPVLPEDAMPAFRATAEIPGTWLELDTVVSADGVPVVIHDSTLDRTTDCAGNVLNTPLAEIERCRIDKLGVSEKLVDAPATPPIRVPRLTEVLAFAKQRGLSVNVEIKRIPGDPGYVPGDTGFAEKVMEVVRAAALDPQKLIVQSFDPSNLDVAAQALPGVQLSFLTLAQANEGAPEFAASKSYQWVSPGGVPSASFMQRSRALGLKVVPYTLNSEEEVKAAAAAGVDAVITDDVPLARRALGLPPAPAPAAAPPAVASPAPARARVSFPRQSRRTVVRTGTLRVRSTGRARISLRLRRMIIARATVGPGITRLRLTRSGRRSLARRRVARLTVVVDGTPRRLTLR
jgi:glycerophosphoryl diester phosphodiesterase